MTTRLSRNLMLAASGVCLAALISCGPGENSGSAPATPAGPPELIERSAIFGNPTKTQLRVSPDGKWLSWVAPRDGVLNIWVAPVGEPGNAKAITSETVRPIRNHFWSQSSEFVLYTNDKGGDENNLLYAVNIATGEEKSLTPFEKTRAEVLATSVSRPNELLIGLNNRDPQWHDAYLLDLRTGTLTLVLEHNEWSSLIADDSLTIRLGVKQTPNGGFDVYTLPAEPSAAPYLTIAQEDSLTTQVLGYSNDGSKLYGLSTVGRDTAALVSIDPATAAITPIGESPKADVQGVTVHPTTGEVEAYSVNYLRNEWVAIGSAIADDLAYLSAELKGDFFITSRTVDDTKWTVAVDPVTSPLAFYLYDRAGKSLSQIFVQRPELEGKPLSPMQPVEIKARDGLTLPSYLTLPLGSDTNGDGKPEAPLPMVLNVHGGPWARDDFGYNPEHQWMANRGYAVLSVNYRGSSGFGKNFLNAANGEFAGKMHDDLIDAVNWAVSSGVTTSDKIAIYGGSYGGYATLVGLTFTPDTFACGVDIVGPSNLVTLIESFPAYWAPFLEGTWYKRVGDPRTPEGRAFLESRSPLFKADQIKKPLLIAQGANDPRVTQKESDQLVAEMKQRNIPVTYVLYKDEGHGFARPENRTSFYAISEAFLSSCLGGRIEPIGDDFAGTNMEVLEGASYVPGLAEALAK